MIVARQNYSEISSLQSEWQSSGINAINVDEDVGERYPHTLHVILQISAAVPGSHTEIPQITGIGHPRDPAIPLLGICPNVIVKPADQEGDRYIISFSRTTHKGNTDTY